MRVLVLGGTTFIGRCIVERLYARGDQVLVVHRGRTAPDPWVPVDHLRTDRIDLHEHADAVRRFGADAIVDTYALTAEHVDAVLPILPAVPTVVLSSVDVYQAFVGFRTGRSESPMPLTENSELRRERYPYREAGLPGVPAAYEKLDVEERWLGRGAVILRLPMVYGPHDPQRRENAVLRRIRAGRRQIPVGPGNLLYTRVHVDDVATGVLAALDTRAADGTAVNLGEPSTVPIITWLEQIIEAAGSTLEPVQVPASMLPADLAVTGAPAQHILVSVNRAEQLLGWAPENAQRRVTESVRWHLGNAPVQDWTHEDAHADDVALDTAVQ